MSPKEQVLEALSWLKAVDRYSPSSRKSILQWVVIHIIDFLRDRNKPKLGIIVSSFQYPHTHPEKESGSLSMTYLPRPTESMGTPGIFRSLRFRSRSLVATM
jgi:hypothetical protein